MLVGNKVVLEEIDKKNIEQMRQWRNDPKKRQWFREYRDITKDTQDKWYEERGNNSNKDHVYFQIMSKNFDFVSEDLRIEERYLIGCTGLHYIDWRLRSAEFGVFLGKDIGEGKGKDALILLYNYGFNELNLHKIWAEVYEGNDSIHLYRKLGFKDEGILRDNFFHNGKYGNSIVMSLLENEWKQLGY
ncbi:MAG: GNAT family protein [Patescibacteria group bacterium]